MRFAPLLLLALILATYANSFRDGFTLDGRQAILEDKRVHRATAENVALIVQHTYWWPYDESGLYRPLTTLSFLFDYAVLGHGDRPFGYHVFNLLLHAANALLLFAIALQLGADRVRALLIAGLWAVHPVLTEAVANIAGRADLLAGASLLGGFWMYLRAREGRRAWFAGVVVAAAVGIFSKESAVVLPGIIAAYELIWGKRIRMAAFGCLATALPIALMLWQRATVLAAALPPRIPFTDNPAAGASIVTPLSVMGRYIALLAWPARLSADYSWAQIQPGHAEWYALLLLPLVFVPRRRPALFVAAAAFLAFLPAANLLFPIGTIMAERFLYLPSIAIAVLAVFLLRGKLVWIAPLLIAVCAARTAVRNTDWRDDRTMAESLVRTSPESFKGHRLLAWELFQAHAGIDDVIAEAERSLAPLVGLPDEENNAGAFQLAAGYYAVKGSHRRSAELYERCLAIMKVYQQSRTGSLFAGLDEVYRRLAVEYLAAGDTAHTAVVLMEGQLATGDLVFRKQLLELYEAAGGCALTTGPAGPAINPACPEVHETLCAALARAGRTAESATYNCPAIR